ncbi:sterol O-acyltransferase [Histoplasma capsulatum var. duboisii H88]|uniref:O-acyltransferase n=1 Tax=Ajellomyces capsulatus (strain H88) TaxID=544711 RepID=F0U8X4_AJEC8|nr:sterol O-acyltransferase [Histoplasma capsulatum var. duboisii H88]QSS52589.1 sterol O-acyltransferase [Histoplasma capsulatum var. duboisii H88]
MSSVHVNGIAGASVLRPRAMLPKRQSEDHCLSTSASADRLSFDLSSGRSTPIPEDAPPSVQSISCARKQIRAQAKRRLFYSIDYKPRVSHFDPDSDYRDFRGFFSLFWVSLFIMVMTTVVRNIKDTGYPLRVQVWLLLSANVWQLGLCDLAMVSSTALSIPLHLKIRKSEGWLRWSNGGMIFQNCFQAAWLALWVALPFILRWTWTSQVFFILHTLTLLMKMHSYAFYNGHLSETEHRLSALDKPEANSLSAAVRYPRFESRPMEENTELDNGKEGESQRSISKLRSDLATELTSPLGQVSYPQNLTLHNYVDYLLCPTLCYELEYPRTEKIRWMEVFFKTLAVFGCIFLLTHVSEEFIVPVLDESAVRLQDLSSGSEKALVLAETISMLLLPFMITFLLVFLVIFEYTLNAFAEITRFADRKFYADWWNSCDWLEFSREWNIPVHHFLRRHVYFSSLTRFSNSEAMFITFLVSSIGHELVMSCITKKIRGYGFLAMMMQLPIVAVQRSKFVKGRKVLNNVCFWISMIIGLSLMCALYVLV